MIYEAEVIISYSHEDMKTVKQIALQLSLRGFDLWMDEKTFLSVYAA